MPPALCVRSAESQAVWLRWKNHRLQVTTSFLFWKLDHSMKVFKNDKKPWFWGEFSLIFQTCILSKMKETLNQVFNPTFTTTLISQELMRRMSERQRGLSNLPASIPHTLLINSETLGDKILMLASLYMRVLHTISPAALNTCRDRGLSPGDATRRDSWLHYQDILKLSLVCGCRLVHSHVVFS